MSSTKLNSSRKTYASCLLQMVNCTASPLVPGTGSQNYYAKQVPVWEFATVSQKAYAYFPIAFTAGSSESQDSAYQNFFQETTCVFKLVASTNAPATPVTPELWVEQPEISPTNVGLFVIAYNTDGNVLGVSPQSLQWVAWSVNLPSSPQIASLTSANQKFGLAFVDLAMLFPAADAQALFAAIQNNTLTPSQRAELYGAMANAVGDLTGSAWMTRTWSDIKNRTLAQICVPGTHDAGTAVTSYATDGSTPCNTQTQALPVLGQLNAGARYLDLRPCYWPGSKISADQGFYLAHFTKIVGLGWGALGQRLDSVLNDVRTFCQTCGQREVIILKFSHFAQLGIVEPLTTNQFERIVDMVTTTLKDWLFTSDNSALNLNSTLMSTLNPEEMNKPTVVALFSMGDYGEEKFGFPTQLFNSSKGIFAYLDTIAQVMLKTTPNFSMYDVYSNTNEFSVMANDQEAKFKRFNANGYQSFLLSWTMTCQSVRCKGPDGNCISGMAQYANPQLSKYIGTWANGKVITATRIPNVLYLDYFDQYNDDAVALSAMLNAAYKTKS